MYSRKKIPFDTKEGVEAFLMNRDYVEADADKGHYTAMILKTDFEAVEARVKLTPTQKKVKYYLYVEGITQRETAEIFGISQQAIQQRNKELLERYATAFKKHYRGRTS